MGNKQKNRIWRVTTLTAFLLVSFNLQLVVSEAKQIQLAAPTVSNYIAGNFEAVSDKGVNLQAGTDLKIYNQAEEQYAQNAYLDPALLLNSEDIQLKQAATQPKLAVQEKASEQIKITFKQSRKNIVQRLDQNDQKDLTLGSVTNQKTEFSVEENVSSKQNLVALRSGESKVVNQVTYDLNFFEILRC